MGKKPVRLCLRVRVGEMARKKEKDNSAHPLPSASRGLSLLEALFLSLFGIVVALKMGVGLFYAHAEQKMERVRQNGQAIEQWFQAAYLSGQLGSEVIPISCMVTSGQPLENCLKDLQDEIDIFSKLGNPYYPADKAAPVLAYVVQKDLGPVSITQCRELPPSTRIETQSGRYMGQPKFWRGILIIHIMEQRSDTAKSAGRSMKLGYCDDAEHYQKLADEIPF